MESGINIKIIKQITLKGLKAKNMGQEPYVR
jgi:hypothetical protein